MRFLSIVLVLLLIAASALAAPQEEPELVIVEVQVTAVSGRSVYLDQGRDAGIEPGDRVRLQPFGSPVVEGEVRSVSSASSRAELAQSDAEAAGVDVGTRGTLRVPAARLAKVTPEAAPPEPPPGVPEHPPWTAEQGPWQEDVPLLAAPRSLTAAEREDRFEGRLFTQLDHTWEGDGESRRDLLARSGLDLEWENPFGRGDGLHLEVEAFHRSASFESSPDEEDSRARLDRASYYWGGTRDAPRRWEMGRFLQRGFPEFGVLDGVELAQRIGGRTRVGGSLGYLPEPTDEMSTGQDVQVAGWVRRDVIDGSRLGWGLGLQKTWHEGAPDRDLMVGTVDWVPEGPFSLRASAWVDYYTEGDTIKPAGPELTEAHVSGHWRSLEGARWGLGFHLDHLRWPEIDRNEFSSLAAADLRDRRVDRAGLSVWREVAKKLRLSGRVDLWNDEDDSGGGGEVRADWRDLIWERGSVGLGAFTNQGAFTDVSGLRLSADRFADAGYWRVDYELTRQQQDGFVGSQEDLIQHALRGSYDRPLGENWDASLFVDKLFGDQQDALSVGLFLQWRF